MKNKYVIILFSLFSILFSLNLNAKFSAEELKDMMKKSINVFIDCPFCDMEYIKTEVNFVNYVRERKEADVHIIITKQRAGNGGKEYTLDFIGERRYKGKDNRLQFFTQKDSTHEDVRREMVRNLKIGLIYYISSTPISKIIDVKLDGRNLDKIPQPEDKWDYWVFNIGFRFYSQGEALRGSTSLRSNFSINRVTEESKLRIGILLRNRYNYYEIDSDKYTNTVTSKGVQSIYVRSVDEHWSVGAWFSYENSTYKNYVYNISPQPAVEYNFFPYSEATRRQLRVLYRIGPRINKYYEETVYGKLSEVIWKQVITVALETKETWGTTELRLFSSNFLNDFSKHHIGLSADLNFRIIKGLSVELAGHYSRIHDQINLPKGDASLEDILLRLKEIESNYYYKISVGLNFTFGSIYSNIVNPRFGS